MSTLKHKQKGIAAVILVISLFALFAVTALAVDMSNHYQTKTLVQNALDASALAGAKVLNDSDDTALAQDAALEVFNFHLTGKLAGSGIVPTVEFSDTLVPFVDGGAEPDFIRLTVSDYDIDYLFAQIFPDLGATQTVIGSAVAGPSPPLGTGDGEEICDLAPMLICAGLDGGGNPITTCDNPSNCYGYNAEAEELQVMKTGAGSDWEVGAGNFQMLELSCGTGGDCVRKELAGEFSSCLTIGETATTEPGNTVGPVSQGLLTRWGQYQGQLNSDEHPPDVITTETPGFNINNPEATNDFWYDDYKAASEGGPYDNVPRELGGPGAFNKRVLTVPVGNCTGTVNGSGEVEIYGAACMFLPHRPTHQGNTQNVYGQFIGECEGDGDIPEFPPGPGVGTGIYRINLYKNPDNAAT